MRFSTEGSFEAPVVSLRGCEGLDAAAAVHSRRLPRRVVLGGALPALLRRPRLGGQGDRPPRPRPGPGPKAAPLDADRRVRGGRRRRRRRDAAAAGPARPLDGWLRDPEVPRDPLRPGRGAARLGAARGDAEKHSQVRLPAPTPVPQVQRRDELVGDHRNARAGEGDVVCPLDARLRDPIAPRSPAGRVLPGLSRSAGFRAAAPRRGGEAADAGARRARGPGLLTGRGGAHGAGVRRRAAALPRPDP